MPRNPPRPDPAQARTQLDALYAGLASGLSQPEFARHRGISVQALRQIETGRGNPTVRTLDAIARVFGLETGFVPMRRD